MDLQNSSIMKRLVIFMLACMYAASCTSPVDDEIKTPVQDEQEVPQENPEQSEDNQDVPDDNSEGEVGPSWHLWKLSLISEYLGVSVDKAGNSPNYSDPVSPSEMYLVWMTERNDEDSYHHIDHLLGLEEEDYDKLVANIKNALNSAPSQYESLVRAVYAGIRSITITADKVLFGREAGQDLSDKFMIDRFNESYILLSYPDGHALKGYYDDKTMTVADWAQMEGMFYSFRTHYTELPEETYSEVTFTMVIDTTDERTFTGSVKVSFK